MNESMWKKMSYILIWTTAYGSSTFSALTSLLVAHFFWQDSMGGILKTVNIFDLGSVIISAYIQCIQWKWTYVKDRDKLTCPGIVFNGRVQGCCY